MDSDNYLLLAIAVDQNGQYLTATELQHTELDYDMNTQLEQYCLLIACVITLLVFLTTKTHNSILN